jgi:hypothetical protein
MPVALGLGVLVAVLLLSPGAADACQFDVDCGPGSVCYKPRGGVYGTCLRRR